ncbi:MAG TPA: DUF4384 domain-containing protein [Gemmatimonadales bacterium]|nr:DUF4384 domain-containing protein [Gemmatimonadales bacterium]
MISALLLPLLFSGSPTNTEALTQDDPPIRLWISDDRRFLPGDRAKVQVQSSYDGYLVVLHVDPEGRLRVLFPLDPDKDNFVRGDKKYEVRGRGGRETFDVDDTGRGAVYAAVSRDPFRFDEFIIADHWDYRALAPARLREDPEPELNDLVRRMAQGSYDYDILTYDVISRSAYVSSSRYYGSLYDDGWCSFSCGRSYYGHSPFGVSIGLFYGRPYRRYYYDPYYYAYDPFFNPFFYDPYYYAPAYYPRYVYPHHYYGYGRPYYYDRYRTYNRPYTAYRFRGSDGFSAGYRDRRHDLRRSVNTVYTPPLSRVREPVAATPVRRLAQDGAELPSGVAPRRSVGHQSRIEPKTIEGRRAREPEAGRVTGQGNERRAVTTSRETAPAGREAEPRDVRPREQPRVEREPPRRAERAPAPQARPERREVERGGSPAPQVRSSGRAESRGSAGAGRSAGGGRPAGGGGVRRR